jgi:4-hydroxy-2-oxoglutarate aldolase
MLLEGLHIPLTTPFHSDGSVALPKLAANVARYSKTPAAGLIVLGPSGEPTLLSDEETRDVLRTAAEAAAPEKVLLAGIARDSVRSVLALADFAAEHHYDALLVGRPEFGFDILQTAIKVPKINIQKYVESKSREELNFFQTIADRSPLPIVLLSTQRRTLTAIATSQIAAHPNIFGIVDTFDGEGKQARRLLDLAATIRREVTVTYTFAAVTARMKLAAESAPAPALVSAASLTSSATATAEPPPLAAALRTRTRSVGFQILSGSSSSLLAALNAGATGIAPAFAAAAPQACYEIYAAWKDGDSALAEEKQQRIREAAAFTASLGPGGLKYACDLNGYAAGLPRLPHLPPTGSQRVKLESAMQGLRN